jgi:hypothetical protein
MSARSAIFPALSILSLLSGACTDDRATPTSPAVSETDASLQVAPPASSPRGQPYSAWAADWWRWLLEQPATGSPILDATGARCGAHQPDRVWFLAGTFGGDPVVRRCTIPAGRPIVLPLINNAYFAFLSDDPDTRTEAYVRGQVTCIEDAVFPVVEIDGTPVGNPSSYLERSAVFAVHLPSDNLFGATAEDIPQLLLSPSADEGYYLFVQPLPPGDHTLRWRASSTACGFAQDITYHLTVG